MDRIPIRFDQNPPGEVEREGPSCDKRLVSFPANSLRDYFTTTFTINIRDNQSPKPNSRTRGSTVSRRIRATLKMKARTTNCRLICENGTRASRKRDLFLRFHSGRGPNNLAVNPSSKQLFNSFRRDRIFRF